MATSGARSGITRFRPRTVSLIKTDDHAAPPVGAANIPLPVNSLSNTPTEVPGKRPAAVVMSPARIGAAFINPLSHARTTIRMMARERWRVERLRIELDERGEGEALYRARVGKWEFHFFVLSRQLDEAQQIDRNFATRWDATAALCQGAWSPAREAFLREEVPKQLDGWVDYDTIVMSRGNRSGRLFEHVVACLASGQQPDPRQLSQVGYILRTTGFLANGLSGTKPYHGFESDHPLRRPYHAQMCAAFLFREFVFDLVESMAASRSPSAVALAPAYKRYLGLGNSAATGMLRYALNHPRQVNQWCTAWESAFAAAKARTLDSGSPEYKKLLQLLDKSVLHFRQDGRPASGTFCEALQLADELARVRDQVRIIASAGSVNVPLLQALCNWADHHTCNETVEILHAIVLELFPDIIDHFAELFDTQEHVEFDAAMTAGELKVILRSAYDWAFQWDMEKVEHERFFWFHSVKAPQDARRGYRHVLPGVEHENTCDTVRQVQKLRRHLDSLPNDKPAAEISIRAPEFRHIISRVQALRDCEYGEIRDNPIDAAYFPIPAIRFVLAFYGMDKFESAPPKLVRGALLQGAPTADDIADGIEGSWPFPLFPEDEENAAVSPKAMASRVAIGNGSAPSAQSVGAAADEIDVSQTEFQKWAQRSTQAAGALFGMSQEAARAYVFLEAIGKKGLKSLLGQLEHGGVKAGAAPGIVHLEDGVALLDAWNGDLAIAAIPALDVATMLAERSGSGVGISMVLNAHCASALDHVAVQLAQRGYIGVVLHAGDNTMISALYAGPTGQAPWLVSYRRNGALLDELATAGGILQRDFAAAKLQCALHRAGRAGDQTEGSIIIAVKPAGTGQSARAYDELVECLPQGAERWSGDENAARLRASSLRGLRVARQDWWALARFAEKLLVTAAEEQELRDPGFDPTKQF